MSRVKILKKRLFGVSSRIKELRKYLKLTQAQFAKEIDVTQGFIGVIERGQQAVSGYMMLTICEHFSINPNWLLAGEGEMFKKESIASGSVALDESESVALDESESVASGSVAVWITQHDLAEASNLNRSSIKRAVDQGTWRGHILTTRESVGRGGRRTEVLLSSLPPEVQGAYWQSKGDSEGEAKVQELKPVIALSKAVRQEPAKPAIQQAGSVCRVCGQAYGLDREIRAKQESLDMAKATIRDKEELLRLQREENRRLIEKYEKIETIEAANR